MPNIYLCDASPLESGFGIEVQPTTLSDLVGCSNHYATGDNGEQSLTRTAARSYKVKYRLTA